MRHQTIDDYEGCLEPWKLKLVVSRLKAFKLPPDQWPDVLQNLVPVLARFQQTPQGSVSESTALYQVITRHLSSLVRSRRREERRMERHRERLGLSIENAEHHPLFVASADRSAMRLDIQQTLADLPECERKVCQRLMDGDSVAQIARELGLGWHALQGTIARIRKHFANLELDAWLQN